MTPAGWLALALALVVIATPSTLPARALALAAASRVAPQPARPPAHRAVAWQRVVPPCAALVVVGTGVLVGPALAVAVAAVVGVAAVLLRDAARTRSALRAHAELLAAVRLLAGELQAGARPAAALHAAAEIAPAHAGALRTAARAADAGDDAGAVLVGAAATRTLGVAWQIGAQTGAALGDVLAHIAHDLRAVDERRRAVAVALSGPRSSATVLTGLPVVGIALGAAMGAHPVPFLVGAGPGRLVCAIGVALDAAGVLWTRRIVRRAQGLP